MHILKDFVLGHNKTGLVINMPNGGVTVVGGENSTFIKDDGILPGCDEVIYYPSPSKTHDVSTYVFPEATRVAWKKFIKSEILRLTSSSTLKTDSSGQSNAALRSGVLESYQP